ncbi:hypothetical protein AOR_1_1706154 [Paecilomyces variotii No. 5]|uniref:Uncharacterized protein n=1 Tax=Byssochlamys spectabilis (strain No. 5 / NBRC 109023) TaxID=1356009 RepID=V5FLL1_BYSSN|nr:hypothetical protein AOR_1_1706154 [Paecilomyces variotii No. 5]
MFSISLSSIFLVPFLVLISIPLLFSACITICFSVVTLSLRVFVVYLELLYAIVTNFFAFPTSSSSLLNLSGATTPNFSRSKGLKGSSTSLESFLQSSEFTRRLQSPLSRRSANKLQQGGATLVSEDDIVRDYHLQLSSNTRRQSYYRSVGFSPGGFLGLTTGDENRDFEGLGGWRSLPSAGGSQSLDDDPDERAWLSMNNRLELPSRLPFLDNSGSDMLADAGGAKHHRRSATTSALTNDREASAAGASGNVRNASISTSTVNLRPQHSSPNLVPEGLHSSASRTSLASQASLPKPNMSRPRGRFTTSPEFHSGDGYFALRRPRSNSKPSKAGGSTTPRTADERATMNIGLSISHYPTSPDRRRRGSGGSPTSMRAAVPSTSAWLGGRPEAHDDFHAW